MSRDEYYRVFGKLLCKLGISADLRGYHYIVYICTEIITYSDNLSKTARRLPMNNLYKMTATRYNTKTKNVDNCVQTAIGKIFSQENYDLLDKIFGLNTSPKSEPTKNKVFVYALCNYVNAYSDKINL